MTTIPALELRNNLSAILRRVEAGATFTVAVRGRPVARIVPLAARPQAMSWATFVASSARASAHAALAEELADAFTDHTDDV
jgi:prevent-host-death family protein